MLDVRVCRMSRRCRDDAETIATAGRERACWRGMERADTSEERDHVTDPTLTLTLTLGLASTSHDATGSNVHVDI